MNYRDRLLKTVQTYTVYFSKIYDLFQKSNVDIAVPPLLGSTGDLVSTTWVCIVIIVAKIRCDVRRLTQSIKSRQMMTWIKGITELLFQDTWINLKDGLL